MSSPKWSVPRFTCRISDMRRLCWGEAEVLERYIRERQDWTPVCLFWIFFGGAAYGCTLGLWQWGTPQPVYVALKIPLLFLLTAVGNGILNGMLAQLLGLHLLFWGASMSFGLKLLFEGMQSFQAEADAPIRVWVCIFALVCLQMTTTLRPLLGPGETLFTSGKQFFLQHWSQHESKNNRRLPLTDEGGLGYMHGPH